jgi:CBS domain-containing protein
MHDIVEFLRQFPPFDDLDEAGLEELAKSVEVEFFAAGTTIIRQGEAPLEHARVIRRGAVELLSEGRVLDVLGEGELFGHPSMLSGMPAGLEARAVEDTLCYRLPADAVVALLGRPTGVRYLARSLLTRPRPDVTASGLDVGGQPLTRLVHGRPVVCEPAWTIRDVAGQMADSTASAALVRLPEGEFGIVTDRDLRDRVIAGELDADAPVSEAMSAPAYTITPERSAAEAMLEMLEHDLHHLPVVWPQGDVLGVLTYPDLVALEAQGPFAVRRAIAAATDMDHLQQAAADLRSQVIALHDAGVPPMRISSVMTIIVDALTRRTIQVAMKELGRAPGLFTWLTMGSLGRREMVPSSDVESGLVWDGEGERIKDYMSTLGIRVVEGLAAGGLAADPHGATAAKPLFDRSFGAWRDEVRNSIEHPDSDKALIFLSLLADARPVYGVGDVRDPLAELRQVWHRRPLLRLLLRLALANRPPGGLRRRLASHTRGARERRADFDLKRDGVLPIVAIARYASLAAGVRVTSTRERLDAASTAGTLTGRDARILGEAHELLSRLRLEHQVEQLRDGTDPDDHIDPQELSPVTRGYLREALHAVRSVQDSLERELRLPP